MLLKLYDKNNNPQDLQRIIDILNDGGLIIYQIGRASCRERV